MTWMVDLQLIVDVLEDDPTYGRAAARLIDEYRRFGELYISPVAYIQLGPLFGGFKELQDKFLANLGIALAQREVQNNTALVLSAWCRYVKSSGDTTSEIPFTKLLIGAASLGYDGLLTRRPLEFTRFFPKLNCVGLSSSPNKSTKGGV